MICTFVGLTGFVLSSWFVDLPGIVIAIAIGYPLYAIALAIHIDRRPAPSRGRRSLAVLFDNLIGSAIAYSGGGFAAYVGFHFLTTVGWGLRFGRRTLFVATAIAIGGMAFNLAVAPYWQEHMIFGVSIILGLMASAINTAILLNRIKLGDERLAEKSDEVAKLAWQDPLTRLPNRLHFQERLGQVLAAATRIERQVALLMFDIDGVKAVNDRLGHQAGDRLLQEVAQRVGRRLRQADTFARFGGDEFVVLTELAHDHLDAIYIAENVIKVIEEIDLYRQAGLRISASCGIACYTPGAGPALAPHDLLKLAERAMRETKGAGKGGYRIANYGRTAGASILMPRARHMR